MFAALARPALFALDPERAHGLTITALARWGAAGTPFAPSLPDDPVEIAGLRFRNRLGLAAGVDKDAQAIAGFFGLGFGAVEVGTLTPLPQPGNPRPRLFRLVDDDGVVNRMGFNNGGVEGALPRLAAARRRTGVLGVNVGANKDSADRVADYARAVARVAPHADYVTINVSSPNTPGLRDLQAQPALGELLAASDAARHAAGGRVPLFLKIAPDLDRAGIEVAVRAAVDNHVDALIVSNTTISRPSTLRSPNAREAGGLSGAPLRALARAKLAEAHAMADGALPLISAGGIDSADEALRRIDAGAVMVQLYSALVYRGPGLAARIVRGMAAARRTEP
ncbi:quinone-dependent dihydroorotate dehydrogenase [Sphingomonas baiyangensis]|uniref:Dihydroorotate dehydrogenase (quinone) n=1 Tax=Sphingomonas baiyangensis TaxID=2572576 RepID=A0A4U1L6U5_9SPHN|nr:quinone-dependent dihydroorotate dehydrogenase [Sphingomonas baiyangensis]TKD52020.1 quinone-dependent dihydroorotate dehydrogenase [Sphingomonas baiyangensis]